MTFLPACDLDAVAVALEALRALEAEPGVDAATDARTQADENAGLSEAHLLVRSPEALGGLRAAFDAVAVRRIAALDRACAVDTDQPRSTSENTRHRQHTNDGAVPGTGATPSFIRCSSTDTGQLPYAYQDR